MQHEILLRARRFAQGKTYSKRNHVEDRAPLETTFFGAGVVRSDATERAGRMPHANKYIITISADLVADDVVNGVLTFYDMDGNATAITIAETYATSHLATVTAIKNDLEAVTGVTVTLSGSNRVLTITTSDVRVAVTTAPSITNGGAGTAVVSSAVLSSVDTIRGFAEKSEVPRQMSLDNTNPEPTYKSTDNQLMPVMIDGDLAVKVHGTPQDGDPVYVLYADYTDTDTAANLRGEARPDDDSGAAPVILVSGAIFTTSKDNGLAVVAIKQA